MSIRLVDKFYKSMSAIGFVKKTIGFQDLLDMHKIDSLEDGSRVVLNLGDARQIDQSTPHESNGFFLNFLNNYQVNASRTGNEINISLNAQAMEKIGDTQFSYLAFVLKGMLSEDNLSIKLTKIKRAVGLESGKPIYKDLESAAAYREELEKLTSRLLTVEDYMCFNDDSGGLEKLFSRKEGYEPHRLRIDLEVGSKFYSQEGHDNLLKNKSLFSDEDGESLLCHDEPK